MDPFQRETRSFDLGLHLVNNASRKLANRQLGNEERLKAVHLMEGLGWEEKAMRMAGPAKLPVFCSEPSEIRKQKSSGKLSEVRFVRRVSRHQGFR